MCGIEIRWCVLTFDNGLRKRVCSLSWGCNNGMSAAAVCRWRRCGEERGNRRQEYLVVVVVLLLPLL